MIAHDKSKFRIHDHFAFACSSLPRVRSITCTPQKICSLFPASGTATYHSIRGYSYLTRPQQLLVRSDGFTFTSLYMRANPKFGKIDDAQASNEKDEGTDCQWQADEPPNSLILNRRDIKWDPETRTKSVRLARKSTLRAVDVEYGEPHNDVDINLAVASIRGSYRVKGRVKTCVTRECDRCLAQYDVQTSGIFELWLKTESSSMTAEEERDVEAIEEFMGSRAKVDLAPHVRDAIMLSLPTKSLCSPDCAGLGTEGEIVITESLTAIKGESQAYQGGLESNQDVPEFSDALKEKAGDNTDVVTMDTLLELKRTLENRNNQNRR